MGLEGGVAGWMTCEEGGTGSACSLKVEVIDRGVLAVLRVGDGGRGREELL